MSARRKLGVFGVKAMVGDDEIYFIIQVLSGLETHRSNE
jgi:hypothetical protein